VYQTASNFIGPVKIIEEGKFKNHFLVTFKNEFILVQPDGTLYRNEAFVLETPTAVAVNYFSGVGQEFFMTAPLKGGYICYSIRGQKIKTFSRLNESSKQPIVAWKSQNRIFLGVFDGTQFHMIDYQKNKIYRSFQMDDKATPFRQQNEIVFYSNLDKQLNKIDQKGQVLQKIGMTIQKLVNPSESYLLRVLENKLQCINLQTSEIIKNIDLKSGENIESFDVLNTGKNQIIAVLDGITNKIFYFDKSNIPSNSGLVGQKKIVLSKTDSQKTYLYTLNDTYIVRYELPL
jgi:hypothetical protein